MAPRRSNRKNQMHPTQPHSISSKSISKPSKLVDYDTQSDEEEFTQNAHVEENVQDSTQDGGKDEKEEEDAQLDAGSEGSSKSSPKKIEPIRKGGKKKKSSKFYVGFRVDLQWCLDAKWTDFLKMVHRQKWVKLFDVCACEGLYEREMTEFCSKFQNENGLVISVVNGDIVKFDAKILAKFFEVPYIGYKEYCKGKVKLNVAGAENAEILTFFGGKTTDLTIEQKTLQPYHKLLFQLVWRFLLPRPQKRATANLMDLSLMFCMAKGLPINFPSIMISHLTHCIKNHMMVGYGNLLTYVFKQCKVKLDAHPTFLLENDHVLNNDMLKRNSLVVKNGELIKLVEESGEKRKTHDVEVVEKGVRKSRRLGDIGSISGGKSISDCLPVEDTGEPVPPTDEEPVPPVPPTTSVIVGGDFSGITQQLQQLSNTVMSRFDVLEAKIDGFELKLQNVKRELINRIQLSSESIEHKIDDVVDELAYDDD